MHARDAINSLVLSLVQACRIPLCLFPFSWLKCPISGETERLSRAKLISDSVVDEEVLKVARIEWVWGLKRGGLLYYLAQPHNCIFFRKDIAHMYARFEFTLAPTFDTYTEKIQFLEHAGIKDRNEKDQSPRRPLTALSPTGRLHRYVFLPFTDAARKLQSELNLQPQTDAGIDPPSPDLAPCREGCQSLPVVECYAHPYSVSTCAERAFKHHTMGAHITADYSVLARKIVRLWSEEGIQPPAWFVNTSGMDEDDQTLTSSEGAGYEMSVLSQAEGLQAEGAVAPQPSRKRFVFDDDEAFRANVSDWAKKVDPKSKPRKQSPIPRSEIPLRPSVRIYNLAHPYRKPPPVYRPDSPVRQAPWPTGEDRDLVHHPPAWTKRNGRFPTRRFSSNDWAYFCRGVALAAPGES
ncbi:hypothetical protein EV122DRAFT_290053 [Schizophyllum commune]